VLGECWCSDSSGILLICPVAGKCTQRLCGGGGGGGEEENCTHPTTVIFPGRMLKLIKAVRRAIKEKNYPRVAQTLMTQRGEVHQSQINDVPSSWRMIQWLILLLRPLSLCYHCATSIDHSLVKMKIHSFDVEKSMYTQLMLCCKILNKLVCIRKQRKNGKLYWADGFVSLRRIVFIVYCKTRFYLVLLVFLLLPSFCNVTLDKTQTKMCTLKATMSLQFFSKPPRLFHD